MELILFVLVVILICVGSFWLAGILYGLLHRPALYFPLSLATKMAACAVFGSILFMLGGVILSTMVFNAEMSKRADYRKWPTILSGSFISMVCTVIIYFAVIKVAWLILD